MRKKRVLLLCLIGAALALTVLLTYNPISREPSYDGHPLSYWVLFLQDSVLHPEFPNPDYDKATNAIDHIGVAALPFLVKWIQLEPSRWQNTLGALVYRTPLPFAHDLSGRITEERTWRRAVGTCYAFENLGKRAMPAFDDLCRLINDTNRPNTAGAAVMVLAYLGTNAVPPLVLVITNPNHPARLDALRALERIHDLGDAAQLAVSALTNCLNDTNQPAVQMAAVRALGNLKALPKISVPALISSLNSTNPNVRASSASALSHFGPQASGAIAALTNALTDPDLGMRKWATDALHCIDPATFTNASLPSVQQ